MNVKRFIAQDIRQAMQMVKDELGDDAVIMSNRSIDEGVEMVAAKDFDETVIHDSVKEGSVATDDPNQVKQDSECVDCDEIDDKSANAMKKKQEPVLFEQFMQDMRGEIESLKTVLDSKLSDVESQSEKNTVRSCVLHQLAEIGISNKLAIEIVDQLHDYQEVSTAFEQAKGMLAKALPIAHDNLLDEGGIVALVGTTGVGKTTTIAKLAAKFIVKHGAGSVALITMDNYRVGAHEQLSIYGRLLDVPVRVATDAEALRSHIDYFDDKQLVLIDTAGMSPQDMRLADQIHTLQQHSVSVKTYLVMSASTQQKALNEIVDAFKVFNPVASILTKLDETVLLGSTLSTMIEHQLPISFMTNGQNMPEDIYYPHADKLINQSTAQVNIKSVCV
jgi:flagellar biosynthesis protein FlhF